MYFKTSPAFECGGIDPQEYNFTIGRDTYFTLRNYESFGKQKQFFPSCL